MDILIPVLGQAAYNTIATLYKNGTELSASQAEFLRRCQDVVAYFTVLTMAPELSVGISDMGIVEKGSNSAPVNPVAQWRYKEFKYDLTLKADRMLDGLIAWLDDKVRAEDAVADDWKKSDQYKILRTNFFASAKDFNCFVQINNSRRLFTELYQDILQAEERVDKVLGVDQFNALVDTLKEDDEQTDKEKALILRCSRYIAAQAIANCMPRLFLTLDSRGLSLSSWTDGFDANNHMSSTFRGAEAVSGYIQRQQRNAEVYFKELIAFIYDHIEDYPLIKDSHAYSAYKNGTSSVICEGPGGVFF